MIRFSNLNKNGELCYIKLTKSLVNSWKHYSEKFYESLITNSKTNIQNSKWQIQYVGRVLPENILFRRNLTFKGFFGR